LYTTKADSLSLSPSPEYTRKDFARFPSISRSVRFLLPIHTRSLSCEADVSFGLIDCRPVCSPRAIRARYYCKGKTFARLHLSPAKLTETALSKKREHLRATARFRVAKRSLCAQLSPLIEWPIVNPFAIQRRSSKCASIHRHLPLSAYDMFTQDYPPLTTFHHRRRR
jgi:hypothetical protein